MRLSILNSVIVQVPCSTAVWTNSFNAVKRVPSCSVTAFSTGSCWPAACVASSAHQQQNNIETVFAPTKMHPSPCPILTFTIKPRGRRRRLTRARFVRSRLAFLSGNQPVHFLQHLVNLRQDQQLGQEIQMRMINLEHSLNGLKKTQNVLLLLLRSSHTRWQSETVFPPPHPDETKNFIQ